MISSDAVWFITGASSGLGRALAAHVLDRGYRAALTARDPGALSDLVAGSGDRAVALALDVTDPAQIEDAVRDAAGRFGRVDVLVNNAGYGLFATVEEATPDEVRAQFETNVYGPLQLTQAVLPGMRERGSGHVVNVSSIGGLAAFNDLGVYCASKFAVEGLSETMALEVEPFGIGVTIVEPGVFRTGFLSGRHETSNRIPAYESARSPLPSIDGSQPNDPVLGAAAIVAAVESDEPPLHLLLGADALAVARQKLDALRSDFDAWADISVSTAFPDAQGA